MEFSVAIPTYNSARFIRATIESVLNQSLKPREILVVDDGSTDETAKLVESYSTNVKLFCQQNRGVARARNYLCEVSRGDVVAFLDHDDIWHPHYLEVQHKILSSGKQVVAGFTGHVNFGGFDAYQWPASMDTGVGALVLIDSLSFLTTYNHNPGPFGSMSFCCLTRNFLAALGAAPFSQDVSGADDFHLFNKLPMYGDVAFSTTKLCAYRVTSGAHSANRLKSVKLAVRALELLLPAYIAHSDEILRAEFRKVLAAKRRYYSRYLMGAGSIESARTEIRKSLSDSAAMLSLVKGLFALSKTYLPPAVQPKWPKAERPNF